ncbi:MAG TPA: CHAT domain-containing protein [Anaerolineae bacterium]|nr:CHAT domain-containing protein [Anaerolineae bacterium]
MATTHSTSEKIVILFLAANPSTTTRLRLDEEVRAIDQVLRQADYRDEFDLRQHWAVRVADLQELLLRHKPEIVHFSGHGSQVGQLLLEDDRGREYAVPPEALSQLFSILRDNLRCVVLNACYSERQAKAIAAHIDCVVGIPEVIGDIASRNFAASFYQALAYGRDMQTAFDLGSNRINLQALDESSKPKLLAWHGDPRQVVFAAMRRDTSDLPSLASRFPPREDRRQRMLDAAMPSSAQVGRATELIAMVRRTDSGGLRAILEIEDDFLPTPEDVRTRSFEIDFPIDSQGIVRSARVIVKLQASDFTPPVQEKEIVIPPEGDSEVVTFQLTPQKPGRLTVHVELHETGIFVGTRVLRTNVELDDIPAPASQQYVMVSIPMVVRVQESSAVSLASASSFAYIKRQTLKDHLQALLEEYQAANAQLSRTLSDVDRVRLDRQLRVLEQRIAKTEADLAAPDQQPVATGAPGGASVTASALTPSQRRHLEQEHSERRRKYDSLTRTIAALDLDISRTQEERRKQPLEEQRAELVAERDQIVGLMRQIEAQPGSDVAQPGQLNESPVQASAAAASQPLPTATTTTAPVPAAPAVHAETGPGGWFSRLPDAGKAAVMIGVFAVIVAFIYVVAKVIPPLPPQVKVTSPTLDVRYGPYQPDPLQTPPPVITVAAQGDTFEITGRDQPTPAWWQVSVVGQSGWVSATLVTTQGAVEDVPVMTAVVALRTHDGKYVTAWNDEGDRDWKLWGGDATSILDWEKFTLQCEPDGRAVLRTDHDRYVTAMDDSDDWYWVLRAETERLGASESFTLLDAQTKKDLTCSDVVKQLTQSEVSVAFLTAHCLNDTQNEASSASLAERCRHVAARNETEDGDWHIWADEPGPIPAKQIFTLIKQN